MLMHAELEHDARPARVKQDSARRYRLASRTVEERAPRGQTPRMIDRVHAV